MEYGEVLDIKDYGDYKEVITAKQTYQTKYVLIATGTKERQMNLEKEMNLLDVEFLIVLSVMVLSLKIKKLLSSVVEIQRLKKQCILQHYVKKYI